MGQDLNDEIFIDSLDEFRGFVLEAFRRKLRATEKKAEEAGLAILGEFRVGAEHLTGPLLLICYVCVPGKAARVVRVDGPENCSALFSRNDGSLASLH